jgi:hypothetical protein
MTLIMIVLYFFVALVLTFLLDADFGFIVFLWPLLIIAFFIGMFVSLAEHAVSVISKKIRMTSNKNDIG